MSGITFGSDILNSRKFFCLIYLVDLVCLVAGVLLYRYRVFAEKPGFFVVVFAVPLIFLTCFEVLRLIYVAMRHENPCISVRSGRRTGEPPPAGFFTDYPPGKVISWADRLFGVSQMMVPLIITFVLIVCSLAMNW
jgi:hypothetical protein